MKRLLLAITLAMSFTTTSQAAHYLTFQRIDGSETSIEIAEEMAVYFLVDRLEVILNNQLQYTIPHEELNEFFISPTATGIQGVATDRFRNGARVEVFGIDGRKAATYFYGSGQKPQLPSGLYIFRSEGKSFKQFLP